MGYDWSKHVLSYAAGPAETGVLIAVRPERQAIEGFPGEELVLWYDDDHQRLFEIKKVVRDDFAVFEFVDRMGRKFTLRPMDLAAYNKHVKPKIPGARSFKSEDDLRRFFTQEIYEQPMEL